MSTTRHELLHAFDLLLAPSRFKDYGPNGLQVEGRTVVRKIVSGVTASRALIEAAIHAEADAIFVHHGLFWRGQDGCVTGWMKQRLGLLLGDDVNLFAYHLPLDAHPSWATTHSSACSSACSPMRARPGASASRSWASWARATTGKPLPAPRNWPRTRKRC